MGEQNLVKIELGCGKKKTEGYIGLDRFPLQGVDVVANMEEGLPFPDNYADIILACHSLEHIGNFEHLLEEIYRVSKHKTLVFIVAPYSRTTLNSANLYHKTVFNENTFRFFTSDPTAPFDWQEYKCDHAPEWPLKGSDNSDCAIELTSLHIEFFYFKEYHVMSPEAKRNARHAFNDVCDMIYYVLAVNKTAEYFSQQEREQLLAEAAMHTPTAVFQLREREMDLAETPSVLRDIWERTDQKISETESALTIKWEKKFQHFSEHYVQNSQSELNSLRNDFAAGEQKNQKELQDLRGELDAQTQNAQSELNALRNDFAAGEQKNRKELQDLRGELDAQTQNAQSELNALRNDFAAGEQKNRKELQDLRKAFNSKEQCTQRELAELREELQSVKKNLLVATDKISNSNAQIEQLVLAVQRMSKISQEMEQELAELRLQVNAEQTAREMLEHKARSITAHMRERFASRMKKPPKRICICRPVGTAFYEALRLSNPAFVEGLIMHDGLQGRTVPLTVSGFVPSETYLEYPIRGYGSKLNLFLIGLPESKVFAEIVANDKITDQTVITVDTDRVYSLPVTRINGKAAIRFRTLDNCSMVRVMEISKRVALLFASRELACFVSD